MAEVLTRQPDLEIARIADWMAATLDDCVNYGSHLAVVVADHPKGGYTDGTIAALFRHFLELIDGVAVLIREVCSDAAKPLARSALETSLSLEYILEADTHRRALAYQVAHAHRRISLYRNLNATTEQGKNFRAKVKGDPVASSILKMDVEELNAKETNLLNMLARPEFAPIEAEWQIHGKDGWFSLFGGPRGIEGLARHLQKAARYEILYRSWSESTHATGTLNRIALGPDGNGALLALRFPGDMQQVTLHSALMAIDLMRTVVRAFVPAEEVRFAQWHTTGMSDRIKRLYGARLINILP